MISQASQAGKMDKEVNRSFPPIDIFESGDEVVIFCDVPDLEQNTGIQLIVQRQNMVISGKVTHPYEEKPEKQYRRERFSGCFYRFIRLPVVVMTETVTTAYKNGVLEVRMRKDSDINAQAQEIPLRFLNFSSLINGGGIPIGCEMGHS